MYCYDHLPGQEWFKFNVTSQNGRICTGQPPIGQHGTEYKGLFQWWCGCRGISERHCTLWWAKAQTGKEHWVRLTYANSFDMKHTQKYPFSSLCLAIVWFSTILVTHCWPTLESWTPQSLALATYRGRKNISVSIDCHLSFSKMASCQSAFKIPLSMSSDCHNFFTQFSCGVRTCLS